MGLLHGSGIEQEDGRDVASLETDRIARAGAELLRKGAVERLILSGGTPGDFTLTEADAMAGILVEEEAINPRLLSLERTSNSTLANWTHSLEFMDNGDVIIPVSRRMQSTRAVALGAFVAGKSGLDITVARDGIGVPETTPFKTVTDTLREIGLTSLTAIFIARNQDTSLDELEARYDTLKDSLKPSNIIRGARQAE